MESEFILLFSTVIFPNIMFDLLELLHDIRYYFI